MYLVLLESSVVSSDDGPFLKAVCESFKTGSPKATQLATVASKTLTCAHSILFSSPNQSSKLKISPKFPAMLWK